MASLGVRGGVAGMAQAGAANSLPQAAPQQSPRVGGFTIDFGKPSTWVAAIYVGSVLYLVGAYVMLGRYRVPV